MIRVEVWVYFRLSAGTKISSGQRCFASKSIMPVLIPNLRAS